MELKATNEQVWLVTGGNKGIGAAIVKEALERGHKVVATARNVTDVEKTLGTSPNLLVAKLDITDDGQIQAAVQAAIERFGRIDVLVNNAGYGLLGYFEEMSEEAIRRQVETNVFGTMKVTRAILPIMRKQGSGFVIVVSSTSGIRAIGGGSVYSATKFALEGWAEGMNIDLALFGIRFMIVEPGAFRTDFNNENSSLKLSDLKIDDYNPYREQLRKAFTGMDQKQAGNPAKLARVLMAAVTAANPPLRLLVGKAAVGAIGRYYKDRYAEFEAWQEVSSDSDFD